MSLSKPKFGEVFRYQGIGEYTLVMYIAPVPGTKDWCGLTIGGNRDGTYWPKPGEVAQRVPLVDSAFARWSEVPDA